MPDNHKQTFSEIILKAQAPEAGINDLMLGVATLTERFSALRRDHPGWAITLATLQNLNARLATARAQPRPALQLGWQPTEANLAAIAAGQAKGADLAAMVIAAGQLEQQLKSMSPLAPEWPQRIKDYRSLKKRISSRLGLSGWKMLWTMLCWATRKTITDIKKLRHGQR